MTDKKAKTDAARYDRQLRLWGEDGQSRLEEAHICLLNASATGTETLKNLVLPGIGKFTIVDPGVVDEVDLGNNFFLDESHLGQPRAAVACENLRELNNLVEGDFVVRDPADLIENDIESFSKYTVVVATNLPEAPMLALARFCWTHNIAVVGARAYGFLGQIRISVPEHAVIESKPDDPQPDLRISAPWPELEQYAGGLDFAAMESKEHSHVPYPLTLIKYLLQWKSSHNGAAPSSSAERSEFKSLVIRGSIKTDEENFNEAHRAAHRAWTPYRIPSNTQEVLNHRQVANLNAGSSNFWVMTAALKEFVANEGGGFLPLPGSIPDMTSTTEGYLTIQTIYQAKATKDADAVYNRVKAILSRLDRPADSIAHEEVKHFCKNANFLQVINYRSLEEEYNPSTAKSAAITSALEDPNSNVVFHVLLRACDRFHRIHGHYPGFTDATLSSDLAPLIEVTNDILQELGITDSTIEQKYVEEVLRFGAAELHTLSALVGGVASQETIKLVTHQYMPMNNTFIFNGLNSTSTTVEL